MDNGIFFYLDQMVLVEGGQEIFPLFDDAQIFVQFFLRSKILI